MNASTDTHEDRALEFARAVRERLSDLPGDEADELTDGLQADLGERLADGGELGDPGEYADELRRAAGLPPRDDAAAEAPRRPLRERAGSAFADLGERLEAWWGRTPARRAVRDFVLALRPLWWVARGAAIMWIVAWLFGMPSLNGRFDPLSLALLLGGVVLSVQWGRGLWASNRWLVWLRRAVSLVAIVTLLPITAIVVNRYSYAASAGEQAAETYAPDGLAVDGEPIRNIFAYDCSGEPLAGVQLFRENGQPLYTRAAAPHDFWNDVYLSDVGWEWHDDTGGLVQYFRNSAATMPDAWNVYPLDELHSSDGAEPSAGTRRSGEPGRAPFENVPALGAGCEEAEETDSGAEGPGAEESGAEEPAAEGAAEADPRGGSAR